MKIKQEWLETLDFIENLIWVIILWGGVFLMLVIGILRHL